MNGRPAHRIAFGGILLALSLILQLGGAFLPGIDLTLFAIASVLTAIVIIEEGVGLGLVFYFASSLLSLIIVPNKLALLPFICFFGYWGILKYFIEKIKKGTLQILCKSAFFALVLIAGFLGFREVFLSSFHLPNFLPLQVSHMSPALIIVAGILFLLLYDYIFTLILNYYFRRFKGFGREIKLS